jgi:voltage-gated potassium channel Kch
MTIKTSAEAVVRPDESSMYELFMGLMTIASLVVMFFIVVVRVPQVDAILVSTDTLFCVIFLVDFAKSLARAPDRSAYLFGSRPGRTLPTGVLDLLGSIPTIGIFRFFRVFRLARIARILRARGARSLALEFVRRRAEAAIYIIVITSLAVLVIGSCAIAYIEPPAEGSNIKTGGDAFWWAFVTITTVGYGDRFPVTEYGRFVGMVTMAVGIGIFGVLTSYLSSIFLAPREEDDAGTEPVATTAAADTPGTVAVELAALRAELADLRRLLEPRSGDPAS